jgi:lipoprotein-anchoring transpeptidase ErfK/SrfK
MYTAGVWNRPVTRGRRDAMSLRSIATRVAFVLGATLMLALSGTIAWAAVSDYQVRGLVPQGVSIAGRNLGGMSESQARSTIVQSVSTPMLRPLTVTGGGRSWMLNPSGVVQVDVDTMLNEAYSPRRSATFVTRLTHQVKGEPLPADVKPAYSVDTTAIAMWVAQVSKEIDHRPKDAKRAVVESKYTFKITPAIYGAKVTQSGSAGLIAHALTADAALSDSTRTVALMVRSSAPKVLESSFKKALIVSRSQRKVRLYNGTKLVKAYSIAVGTAAHPTPLGDWVIENKRYLPTWTNPHAGWSAGMPETIAPGYGNPLGTRALDVSASGIRFHGTTNDGSVGTAASHGCMRMHMWDIEDLYPRVPVGTPVFIRE